MMPDVLRRRLIEAAIGIAGAAAGAGVYVAQERLALPSAEVRLAMEMGSYFESSGRHIGTPYVDKLGKGQPLTVCNGVTGPEVVAGRYYTPDDCKQLELPKYRQAERDAKRLFKRWDTYNVWVRASLIDMIYNLGASAVDGSTLQRKANAGDLDGACAEMPRWVYGTVKGQRVRLDGLVTRRESTRELCAEWGRDGHFSEVLGGGQ